MDEINIKTVVDLVKSGSLKFTATQSAINLPILQRIYKKMKLGIRFDNIRVNNSRIIDGHHRYICSILSESEIGIDEWRIGFTAVDHEWSTITVVENDYEDKDQIRAHNERDAEINGVDISIFNDL
tara:strand:+ start:1222 stop:1599 length:378 start_codon:yes stop_codon:yes gene_type:complete